MSESDDSTFLCKQRKPRQLKNKLYFKTVKAATISDVTTGVAPSWILDPGSRNRASLKVHKVILWKEAGPEHQHSSLWHVALLIFEYRYHLSLTAASQKHRCLDAVDCQTGQWRSKKQLYFIWYKSRMFRVLIRLPPELRVFQSVCGYICSFTLTRTVCVTAEVTQDVNAGGWRMKIRRDCFF